MTAMVALAMLLAMPTESVELVLARACGEPPADRALKSRANALGFAADKERDLVRCASLKADADLGGVKLPVKFLGELAPNLKLDVDACLKASGYQEDDRHLMLSLLEQVIKGEDASDRRMKKEYAGCYVDVLRCGKHPCAITGAVAVPASVVWTRGGLPEPRNYGRLGKSRVARCQSSQVIQALRDALSDAGFPHVAVSDGLIAVDEGETPTETRVRRTWFKFTPRDAEHIIELHWAVGSHPLSNAESPWSQTPSDSEELNPAHRSQMLELLGKATQTCAPHQGPTSTAGAGLVGVGASGSPGVVGLGGPSGPGAVGLGAPGSAGVVGIGGGDAPGVVGIGGAGAPGIVGVGGPDRPSGSETASTQPIHIQLPLHASWGLTDRSLVVTLNNIATGIVQGNRLADFTIGSAGRPDKRVYEAQNGFPTVYGDYEVRVEQIVEGGASFWITKLSSAKALP